MSLAPAGPSPRAWGRWLAGFTAGLVLGIGVVVVGWPGPTPASPMAAAPPRDPAEILAERLGDFPCAAIQQSQQDGVLRLSGWIGPAAEDQIRLRRMAQALPGWADVQDMTDLAPPSLCAVIRLAQRWAPESPDSAPVVQALSGADPVISLTAPPGRHGFFYLDAYTGDGRVQHLLPAGILTNNLLLSGQSLTLTAHLPVGQPVLVLAIAVPHFLFVAPRPPIEETISYLADLERAAQDRPIAVSLTLPAQRRPNP